MFGIHVIPGMPLFVAATCQLQADQAGMGFLVSGISTKVK